MKNKPREMRVTTRDSGIVLLTKIAHDRLLKKPTFCSSLNFFAAMHQ